ncbi:SigE family RNA polymerase sigma factor [Trebonia kvetii]|uniref:SigE family RNA polymerase sigma factor n=4 Tax=Actinomycetes TaxID=1760 RepID=A0A6P2BPB6_9ACTN|nr:SigE family RNA polymerase sigma factor [Trebonia kvetii]
MRGRWPAMVRLAYALTGDAGHAEDVAQAAFARAYASWGRVRRAGDPDAYVRRILINENRKRFRKHRVPEDLHGDLAGALAGHTAPGQQGPEERQALLDALNRLGPRQRAVVVLRYWLDLSEAETAATLNCSVGTVKSQASRALATLRKDATTGDQDIVEGGRR